MISGTISFDNCKTLDDIKYAVQEAMKRILQGNMSGFDSNDTGGFSFTVTGEEVKDDEDDETV